MSTTAMKLLQRSEFDGVPQPEVVAELLVRVIKTNDDKARSGLRGCISVLRLIPARKPLLTMIERILKHAVR